MVRGYHYEPGVFLIGFKLGMVDIPGNSADWAGIIE
jgi:hypothetical protein